VFVTEKQKFMKTLCIVFDFLKTLQMKRKKRTGRSRTEQEIQDKILSWWNNQIMSINSLINKELNK
jgi:hypothetical protein